MRCDTKAILVVDDIIPNVKLLSAILGSRGYTVYEAGNGADALAIAEDRKPAIIILDVMMPGMDGFEVCKRLKANPETAESAVIYISAKNSTADKIRGLELGAVDYITKPFQKAEVIARVETHMALQNANARLTESENRYSTLVESAQDGILLWSAEKGVFFSNRSFKRIFAVSGDMTVKPSDFVVQEDLKRFELELSASSLSTGVSRELEFRMAPLKPEDAPCLVVSCLMVGVELSGKAATLVTIRDMTERLLFERHLHHTQKMEALGLLCSGIASDFNNILTLISGYSELALLEAGSDSPLAGKLKDIVAAAKNAVALTRGLFAFARNRGMEPEPLDLSSEIRRIHSVMARGMPVAIEFECETPPDEVQVFADAAMLQQLIVNLCMNARDSMPSGGRLLLSLSTAKLKHADASASREEGDYAIITVKDTGSGVPDILKSKIFDPFFTTKATGKASGLGLSIADKIARGHDGWIEFESVVGEGSTFKAAIPLNSTHELRKLSANVPYRHVLRQELNPVLLADADEADLSITKYFLEKEGYDVSSVHSASEALLALNKEGRFKLLVVSRSALAQSPELSISSIRRAHKDLKILAISDFGSVPIADVPLLKKPFSVKDILQTLDKL